MKRRKFISHAALATGALMTMRCKAENTKAKIEEITGKDIGEFGIQLWSVRNLMAADARGTLKALADIGFKDIEPGSDNILNRVYCGMPLQEFKTYLSDIGLMVRSSHVKTGVVNPDVKGTMVNDWEGLCQDAAELGVKSLVLGYITEEERKSADDYKRLVDLLNQCGVKAKEYGLAMGYHNHDFEFFELDGIVPYDMMLAQTDPAYVNFELDHYWIAKAGQSSLDYFEKHPGRFHYWHVKDMDDTAEKFFTEVGTGTIDYISIFQKAKQAGMKYFYVEQDDFKKYQPLESLEMSHDYLKQMKF